MLGFMCLFIIMSISVKRQELWCTVRDMRLSKCSIIIIVPTIRLLWRCMSLSFTPVLPMVSLLYGNLSLSFTPVLSMVRL